MNNTNYAGFGRRFAAYIIDALILSIPIYIIMYFMMGSLTVDDSEALSPDALSSITYLYLGNIILFFLYYAYFESSNAQATFGKQLMKIKVADMNGERIGFVRALGRTLAKVISAMILLIGFIMAAFTGKKQALHDLMASCLVLNVERGEH